MNLLVVSLFMHWNFGLHAALGSKVLSSLDWNLCNIKFNLCTNQICCLSQDYTKNLSSYGKPPHKLWSELLRQNNLSAFLSTHSSLGEMRWQQLRLIRHISRCTTNLYHLDKPRKMWNLSRHIPSIRREALQL